MWAALAALFLTRRNFPAALRCTKRASPVKRRLMHPQVISSLAFRPALVFETDLPEFPHTIWGTTFLVGAQAACVHLDDAAHAETREYRPACIFPATPRRMLPLKDVFFAPEADVEDDFADLAVID